MVLRHVVDPAAARTRRGRARPFPGQNRPGAATLDRMASTGDTLGARFDSQPNALNAVRLLLATTVVVWHAHLLPGGGVLWAPVAQLLEQLPVDAFFAISGFLIARSWVGRPVWWRFASARAARLFPGLWACLLVSAFLIVPLAVAVGGRDPVTVKAQLDYVLGNASSIGWVDHRSIEGSTAGLHRYVLNVSIWSLRWELACYLGVLMLGLVGALRTKVLACVAGGAWALAVSWMILGIPDDFVFGIWPMPRLVLMFSLGALAYTLSDRIPLRGALAAGAALVLVAAAGTPDYRVFAAPALTYLVLWVGLAAGRFPMLRLETDLSYGVYVYGAPVQQGLLIAGVTGLSWAAFTAVSLVLVLPLAALSWSLVERPASRWVRIRLAATARGRPSPQVSRRGAVKGH